MGTKLGCVAAMSLAYCSLRPFNAHLGGSPSPIRILYVMQKTYCQVRRPSLGGVRNILKSLTSTMMAVSVDVNF